jgi:hypothetical protein
MAAEYLLRLMVLNSKPRTETPGAFFLFEDEHGAAPAAPRLLSTKWKRQPTNRHEKSPAPKCGAKFCHRNSVRGEVAQTAQSAPSLAQVRAQVVHFLELPPKGGRAVAGSALSKICSDIDFNADDAGNTSAASDVIDGSASRTHAPA